MAFQKNVIHHLNRPSNVNKLKVCQMTPSPTVSDSFGIPAEFQRTLNAVLFNIPNKQVKEG